jgi:hypothetical protein
MGKKWFPQRVEAYPTRATFECEQIAVRRFGFTRWVDSFACHILFGFKHRLNMRIIPLAMLALVTPFVGCHMFSSKVSSADAPAAKAQPGIDFGAFPQDYQLRTVETFQAKWPADVVYKYRFEEPRRAQNTNLGRYGYAVRFRAQKVSQTSPMPDGFPWVAYFENGRIVWVQRDTEVAGAIKWFDPAQATVDWPPVSSVK